MNRAFSPGGFSTAAMQRAGGPVVARPAARRIFAGRLTWINAPPRRPGHKGWPILFLSRMEAIVPNTSTERGLIFLLRIALGWTFLYAASHQVFVADFSIVGFLNSTKTFHWLFQPLTAPAIAPVVSFMVAYGHLLIGLSLISGLMVRVSSAFGIFIMLTYWLAHMDFPYISDHNSFIIDFHIVDALVLGLLIATRAGHVWGLDAWAARQKLVTDNKPLAWAIA